MTTLHVVLPADVDDAAHPSGGNHYDRRMCDGLAALGWSVREHAVAGAWPHPDAAALDGLLGALGALPDGGLVLVDGLVAVPPAVLLHADRLRVLVLVHLPLGVARPADRDAECALLRRCAVVTTSAWTRAWLLDHYDLCADRVSVVSPGVDRADPAPGTPSGGRLLVVGRVSSAKGHDLLGEALAAVGDLAWRCVCLGALADRSFVAALCGRLAEAGLADRVELRGPRPPGGVRRAYAAADLLVVPSRGETYGMVVTEALAHGVPVLAAAVGGVPEAMGRAPDGRRPGLLVRPGDAAVLGRALRWWLADARLRAGLRDAASARRTTLTGWPEAATRLADVISHG